MPVRGEGSSESFQKWLKQSFSGDQNICLTTRFSKKIRTFLITEFGYCIQYTMAKPVVSPVLYRMQDVGKYCWVPLFTHLVCMCIYCWKVLQLTKLFAPHYKTDTIQLIEFHLKLRNILAILVCHIIVAALTFIGLTIGLDENFFMQLFKVILLHSPIIPMLTAWRPCIDPVM
jgi:hypothetical protein